jgi:hypothetical protein
MEAALIRLVWQQANGRCEYCCLPQEFDDRPFEIDHIIAEKHQGPSVPANLALSCFRCNSFKGSDISGRDATTGKLTPLFNPRRQKWARHFGWQGPYLVGRTPIGCVTVAVLRINEPFRVALRQELIEEGVFSARMTSVNRAVEIDPKSTWQVTPVSDAPRRGRIHGKAATWKMKFRRGVIDREGNLLLRMPSGPKAARPRAPKAAKSSTWTGGKKTK